VEAKAKNELFEVTDVNNDENSVQSVLGPIVVEFRFGSGKLFRPPRYSDPQTASLSSSSSPSFFVERVFDTATLQLSALSDNFSLVHARWCKLPACHFPNCRQLQPILEIEHASTCVLPRGAM
jgi:hypothetical protein